MSQSSDSGGFWSSEWKLNNGQWSREQVWNEGQPGRSRIADEGRFDNETLFGADERPTFGLGSGPDEARFGEEQTFGSLPLDDDGTSSLPLDDGRPTSQSSDSGGFWSSEWKLNDGQWSREQVWNEGQPGRSRIADEGRFDNETLFGADERPTFGLVPRSDEARFGDAGRRFGEAGFGQGWGLDRAERDELVDSIPLDGNGTSSVGQQLEAGDLDLQSEDLDVDLPEIVESARRGQGRYGSPLDSVDGVGSLAFDDPRRFEGMAGFSDQSRGSSLREHMTWLESESPESTRSLGESLTEARGVPEQLVREELEVQETVDRLRGRESEDIGRIGLGGLAVMGHVPGDNRDESSFTEADWPQETNEAFGVNPYDVPAENPWADNSFGEITAEQEYGNFHSDDVFGMADAPDTSGAQLDHDNEMGL